MTTDQTGGTTTAAEAKDEAGRLAHSAADSGQDLLHEVKDEAGDVVAEATGRARDLLGQARAGLAGQASEQQTRAAAGLRSLGDELGGMAEGSEQGGPGTDLVRRVADRTTSLASWLEDREPGDVLSEVADFARRRPGAFLALAVGVGVLAGRLTRALKDAPATGTEERASAGPSRPAGATAEATTADLTGVLGAGGAATGSETVGAGLGDEGGGQHREPGPAWAPGGSSGATAPSEQDAWAASRPDAGPGPAADEMPGRGAVPGDAGPLADVPEDRP